MPPSGLRPTMPFHGGLAVPGSRYREVVAARSARDEARRVVAAYHETQLPRLVDRVGVAVDQVRSGVLSSFEADRVLFQYSRAAKELWKFCNSPSDVEFTAQAIREGLRSTGGNEARPTVGHRDAVTMLAMDISVIGWGPTSAGWWKAADVARVKQRRRVESWVSPSSCPRPQL